jgi:hypothetical protein
MAPSLAAIEAVVGCLVAPNGALATVVPLAGEAIARAVPNKNGWTSKSAAAVADA